jgi:hypothetical protein
VATPEPRTLARLAGFANSRPVYGAACPDIEGRQVVRLAGFANGRPVYATAVPWTKALARLVGFANGKPVYAAADCPGASSSLGSSAGSSLGSSGSGSAESGSAGSVSTSAPSAGSESPGSASGSGSESPGSVSTSAPSLGSSIPSGVSGSPPSGSVESGISGSSASGATHVLVPCCDVPVPKRLVALITNKTGNCDCLPDSVLVNYLEGGLSHLWNGTYPQGDCIQACDANLECRPDGVGGDEWRADIASCAVFDTLVSVTCDPFEAVFDIDNTLGAQCQGTYRITFIEAP